MLRRNITTDRALLIYLSSTFSICRALRPSHRREPSFGYSAASSEPIDLTAPTLPVPPASAKQKHNDDDNQNHFYTHFEALLIFDLTRFREGLVTLITSCRFARHFLACYWTCVTPSLKSLPDRGYSSLVKREHITNETFPLPRFGSRVRPRCSRDIIQVRWLPPSPLSGSLN
jgi:hypothetical protein